jgi:hypothetical protein
MRTRHARLATLLFLTACGGGGGGTDLPTGTPASITLSATTVNLASLNETEGLTATVMDAGGVTISAAVTWSTSSGAVASVSNSGQVTAVGNGTAQIVATAGSVADTADVTVQQVAVTLTLTPDTLRLGAAGDTATLGRTVRDALGSTMTGVTVTWATVHPSVATVNGAGRVTAVKDSVTTIYGQVAPGGPGLTKQVRVEVGGLLPPAYLRGGYPNVAYSDQIDPVNTGTGYTYVVTNGALPNGLTLNASNRQITGTPTNSGAFFFEVTASNGTLTRSERFAITISTQPSSAFNLWLAYNGGPMPGANAQAAITAALARFEQVITGDIAPAGVTYPSSGLTPSTCQLVNASLLNGAFIDDVSILMAIRPYDGLGNTLARGGFCGYGRNPAPPATITGQMELDQVDAAAASVTYLQDVIWHEIAHAFGVGTLWQSDLQFVATDSVRYYGTNGNAEWRTLGGPADGVPVELPPNEAHWRENWFNAEIMTPTTEGPAVRLPISRMTIATLSDLGWSVTLTAADAYTLPGCSPGCSVPARIGAPGEGVPFDEVVNGPLLPLPPGSVGPN